MQTVRCALIFPFTETGDPQILFLQKDTCSKNPSAFELPGGKVCDSFLGKCWYRLLPFRYKIRLELRALKKEVWEETGIDISQQKVFEVSRWEYQNTATHQKTNVAEYGVIMSQKPQVSLNHLPEDKHCQYQWLSQEDFEKLSCRTHAEPHIAQNSQYVDITRYQHWSCLGTQYGY